MTEVNCSVFLWHMPDDDLIQFKKSFVSSSRDTNDFLN